MLATTVREQRRILEAQARSQERAATTRALHDTVLNTLDAVATGRLRAPDSAALRAFVARDIAVLRQASLPLQADESSSSLTAVLTDLAAGLESLAVTVVVAGHGPPRLPPEVMGAMVRATREALSNVTKHAATDRALIRVEWAPSGAVSVITRDEGSGFAKPLTGGHFGVAESILRRMRDVGGNAVVVGDPGVGTTVTLHWKPRTQAPPTTHSLPPLWAETVPHPAAIGLICYSSIYAMGLFATQVPEFPVLWPQVVALSLVLIGDVVVAVQLLRHRRLSTVMAGLVAVRVPIVMLFSGLALEGCQRMGFSMFVGGSSAALCGILAMVGHVRAALVGLLGHSVVYVLLALELFAAGEECSTTVANQCIIAAALVLAGWWFVRALARHTGLAHAAMSEVEEVQRQRLIADSVAAERSRLYPVLRSALLDTVTGLADGQLDPGSAEVRSRCRRDAVLLRSYLTQAIDSDEIMTTLFATSIELRYQGVDIAVRGRLEAGTLRPDQRRAADRTIRDTLTSLVSQGWTGSCILTALSTSRSDVIGLHIAGVPPHAEHLRIDPTAVSDLATVEWELDGDQLLLTLRFARYDRNESLGSPPYVDQLA